MRLLPDTHVVPWWPADGPARPPGLPELIRDSGFTPLPVSAEHAIAAGRLPVPHRDPFGRMLVAQAQREDLTLVTRDQDCRQYKVTVLPA